MKQIRLNRAVQIIYPLLVYFVIYQLGVGLLADVIGDKYGRVMCLLISATITIIPMLVIYQNVPKIIPEKIESKKQLLTYMAYVLVVVGAGLLLNVILTHSFLIDQSAGFSKANSTLSDGTFFIRILCNAIAIPILEELLIRGIITGQLCLWYGKVYAVIISSFCFGILHNNIVQFIYALVVGIMLGIMYVNTKRLSLCILAHGLINFLVIMITSFGGF